MEEGVHQDRSLPEKHVCEDQLGAGGPFVSAITAQHACAGQQAEGAQLANRPSTALSVSGREVFSPRTTLRPKAVFTQL